MTDHSDNRNREDVLYHPSEYPPSEQLQQQPAASKGYYRFVLLFFNCMLTFGSYFCFDMPSVLQESFTASYGLNCTHNSTKCTEGLGLSQTKYNLLYTVYAWMNAAIVIASGFLLDKLGNRIGVLLFSGLCVVGSSTFAAGYFLKGPDSTSMFALFMIGRLLFGAGNGSLTIVQNRISAFWFDGKELAFAFGCTLAFSRLGSVLNFLLTQSFNQSHGLEWTLWGGAMLCGLSFFAGLIVTIMDKEGVKQLNKTEDLHKQSKKLRFGDVRYFRAQYWLLVFTTMFFYNGVFPFVADASEFIQQTYNYHKIPASYIAGAVYDVSMVVSPGMGIIVDYFGCRGILAISCAILTIPVFGIFSFAPEVHPVICTIWLGCTYSVAAASLWPSVPLVVDPGTLGTALGVMTSFQMIGIGSCNLVVGKILDVSKHDEHKWKYVMLFMLANTLACVSLAAVLNLTDWRRIQHSDYESLNRSKSWRWDHGGILNKTTKRKKIHHHHHHRHHPKKRNFEPGYTDAEALLYSDHQERYHDNSSNDRVIN